MGMPIMTFRRPGTRYRKMRRSDVLERCRLASEAIQQLPPHEWAGWLGWMLESIDEKKELDGDITVEEILQRVHQYLRGRLESGKW